MVTCIFLLVCLVLHSNRFQIWLAIDQLINALLWGWADEAFSARAWRSRLKKLRYMRSVAMINRIFFWQKNHCKEAYESEKYRRQMPPEYRDIE